MRRRGHGFKCEAELVKEAGEWLRADGWDCYFEVAPWGSGAARADIVATRGPLLAIVECKLTLSIGLLEQCRPRVAVKDAIAKLDHHYASPACARSSLISRAEAGVVDGVRVVREGKAVFFEVSP